NFSLRNIAAPPSRGAIISSAAFHILARPSSSANSLHEQADMEASSARRPSYPLWPSSTSSCFFPRRAEKSSKRQAPSLESRVGPFSRVLRRPRDPNARAARADVLLKHRALKAGSAAAQTDDLDPLKRHFERMGLPKHF